MVVDCGLVKSHYNPLMYASTLAPAPGSSYIDFTSDKESFAFKLCMSCPSLNCVNCVNWYFSSSQSSLSGSETEAAAVVI